MADAPVPSGRAPRAGPGVLTNSFINVGAQVALIVFGAVGGLITVKALGPASYGVLAVSFILADFGRALSSCTHVPSILEYHRGGPLDRVFGTSLAIKVFAGLTFAVLLFGASGFLAGVFQIPPEAVLLATAVIVVGSFYEVGAARLEADNQFARNALILLSGSVVGLAAVVALWLTGRLTVLTSIGTTILANLTMSAVAARYAYDPRRIRVDLRLARAMVLYGIQIVIVQLLAQALLQTDTLMVSAILGNADAGVYSVVFTLTFLMVTASNAMGTALVPALSALVARGERTEHGYHRGTVIAMTFSGAIAFIYVAGGPLILSFYGPEFAGGYVPLLILTVFGVAGALAVPASAMLTVHGHARFLVYLSVVQLALNIALNYALIRTMGITGAAIATTAVFVLGTAVSWIAVRRLTGAAPISREAVREARALAAAWARRVLRRG